ncbi:GFA family protein [Aspergillus saccharolyticus JOP 1030-1]|uniref:CENP-V/GFA domain-containing protein n=1 Tax=Aspergillus saccharolyticus JOP 1030-1 TaxID=1450539 RepID=A0A318Z7X4_9EURO|nr:hypothetical protein BP01DRAFT_358663 [Aspergillus saccharolyticus JOP 1030-1]PYH43411.1 hypothetical protein BP01DRAFT_358663 [Aspergillus saccharolyticus JOP 1030-1]
MTQRAISCLCGHVAQEVSLGQFTDEPTLDLCHCTACRTTTGMLCSIYCPLQGRPHKLDSLREYQQPKDIIRFFCKICGAHAFVFSIPLDQYFVAAGLLVDEPSPSRTQSVRHWQASETHDGGLTSFLPGDSAITRSKCWLRAYPYDNGNYSEVKTNIRRLPHDSIELRCRCHCAGIEFYITRPDASSTQATSPWPDLLVPYHVHSSENATDVKWWLRNANTKYLAGTCACPSCRLASGCPIQPWAFIPKANLLDSYRAPLTVGAGTMQRFESSPGVYREFCNRCGASIFWHSDERPLLVDVSVGLLQASEGSLARQWLEWTTSRVSFAEMALDKNLIRRLQMGLQEYAERQVNSHPPLQPVIQLAQDNM